MKLWDYNLPPAPGLIDITKDGRVIPALAQVGNPDSCLSSTAKPVSPCMAWWSGRWQKEMCLENGIPRRSRFPLSLVPLPESA